MVRINGSPGLRVLAALAIALATGCRPSPPALTNIAGVEELKARFNADAGKPRIVLLLSPT